MFNKKISVFIVALMILTGMTSCGVENSLSETLTTEKKGLTDTEKISIVCTIFPEYDWTKEIIGDHAENIELTYLLDKGIDLHSFQPTADDMMKISNCDLFIYVGGESDSWVDDIIDSANNKDMKVINLMETLGDSAKVEELKEGMQESDHDNDEHDHHHDNECDEEHEHDDGEVEYDEHVWLSLKNAELLCVEIENRIAEIDPDNADDYKNNLDSYISELSELDKQFKILIDSSPEKTLVFGDRFPFRYFVDDYGLDYYAAFIGCSAESEASFETISFLADKVKELDCKTIYTLENSNKGIAESIIKTSGKDIKIAELNSLQSITKDDIKKGANYISLTQKNYDVLSSSLK